MDNSSNLENELEFFLKPSKMGERFIRTDENMKEIEPGEKILNAPVEGIVAEETKETDLEFRAKEFIEGIVKGKPNNHTQAEKIRAALLKIADGEEFKKQVNKLIKDFGIPAELRKVMVRAGLNKTMMEGLLSDDIDARKVALDAIKQISKDPEVGLEASEPLVSIDLGNLGSTISGLTLDGLISKEDDGKENN